LEATAATLFGKEAALFVPTGTMGNLLGILSHTNGAFGAEMIVGNQQHTYLYEQGGASSIGGVHSCVLPNQADGTLLLTDIEQSIRSDDPHYPTTTLVSIENPHNMCGGVPLPMDYVDDLGALTKKHNIKLHFDMFHLYQGLEKAAKVMNSEFKNDFLNYIHTQTELFSPFSIFILKKNKFNELCEATFEWIHNCENIFDINELHGHGQIRLFDYLAERFFSFWIKNNTNYKVCPFVFFDPKLSDSSIIQ
jgi:hypothetical protein